ncbi:MAG: UvrD-helicase domain-containing protein [bacterium]|jgi:DNA helicase-2/ATP-dependent DNA helicase PcrA|nr:ATP-dependent DNA helicase PcrA [Planctomycetota bacterium]HIL53037.1 ATP-dependent DNA helicase PcrA [Planctomycetota bacterium]
MVDWMDLQRMAKEAPLAGEAEAQASSSPALLEGLNEPQREAVTHAEGPLLILAGPGSGKTRVVTQRIAWLIRERGVRPEEVLAITFTNKAAKEMRLRVEALLPGSSGLWISTFHSMCARILRREIAALGDWTSDFSIYDTSDRNQLLKKLLREANYDTTQFRPALVGGWISEWKNEHAGEAPQASGGMEEEVFSRVYKAYEDALRAGNALDFDDLLLKVLELFDTRPGLRDAYASRFRFVMVDEYQDTNRVQYRLTRHLSSYHGNLAVCGDPDQSIYAWRGADIRNILDFERDAGAPKVVKLEQNYRSTGTILKAADAVIRHNQERKSKGLFTAAGEGDLIALSECGDENDEGRQIAMQIKGLAVDGMRYSDVAIFYRANFMQRALESQLALARIPYNIVGGVEFYARREVRDLISHLKLLINPVDDVAFRRIVNVPKRGVGDKGLLTLANWAADRRVSMLAAAGSPEALEGVRGRAKKGLAGFANLMERLEGARDLDAQGALEALIEEMEFEAWMAELDDGNRDDREANVEELHSYAREYDRLYPTGGLRGFLEDISLVSEIDGQNEGQDRVSLMTLHAAKGLEFPAVFIAGLEEELLPHSRSISDSEGDAGLEEERRLFYVGLTRAKQRLFLSYAINRMHFGQTSARMASRFLDEVPSELLEGFEPDADETKMLGAFEAPVGEYGALQVGDRVRHAHFGLGTVQRLMGSGVNARATILFPGSGDKQLLLQYAKLEVLA